MPNQNKPRRFLQGSLRWWIGGVVCVGMIGYGLIHTMVGRFLASGFQVAEWTIRIGSVQVGWPLKVALRGVTISHQNRTVADCDRLEARFAVKDLIQGQWLPQTLTLHRVYLLSQTSDQPFQLPSGAHVLSLLKSVRSYAVEEVWQGPASTGVLLARDGKIHVDVHLVTGRVDATWAVIGYGPWWRENRLKGVLEGSLDHLTCEVQSDMKEITDLQGQDESISLRLEAKRAKDQEWTCGLDLASRFGQVQGKGSYEEPKLSMDLKGTLSALHVVLPQLDPCIVHWTSRVQWSHPLKQGSQNLRVQGTITALESSGLWVPLLKDMGWIVQLQETSQAPRMTIDLKAPWGNWTMVWSSEEKAWKVKAHMRTGLELFPMLPTPWPWRVLDGTIEGHITLDHLMAQWNVQGSLSGQGVAELTYQGSGVINQNQISLENLQLESGEDQCKVSGGYGFETQKLWGDLTLSVKRIQEYLRGWGVGYWGGGKLTCTVPPDLSSAQPAQVSFEGTTLLAEGVYIDQVALEAKGFLHDQSWLLTHASFKAKDVTTGDVKLENVTWQYGSPTKQTKENLWALNGEGTVFRHPFHGIIEGTYDPLARRGVISKGQGLFLAYPYSLLKPVGWRSPSMAEIAFDPLHARLLGGMLELPHLSWTPQHFLGVWRADKIALKAFQAAPFYLPLSGDLICSGRLEGPGSGLKGSCDLHVERLKVQGIQRAATKELSLQGKGIFSKNGVQAHVKCVGGDVFKGNVSLKYPMTLRWDGGLRAIVARKDPLDVSWECAGDLALVSPFIGISGIEIAGPFQTQGQCTGMVDDPRVKGFLTLRSGHLYEENIGLLIQDLSCRIEGGQDQIKIRECKGTDGAQGQLKGEGVWSWSKPESSYLNLMLHHFNILDMDSLEVKGSGALKFHQPGGRWVLSGQAQVHEAISRLDATGADHIKALYTVQHVGSSPQVHISDLVAKKGSASCGLDLDARLPNILKVEGKGLNCLVGGDLKIRGTLDQPILFGDLNLVKGHITFFGKTLTLDRAAISFDGDPQNNPYAALSAFVFEGGVTIQISLMGRLNEATFAVSSVPSLPLDDICSRLLFGKPVGEISPLQMIRLANVAAQLQGKWSMSKVMDQFQQVFDLDLLDFEFSNSKQEAQDRTESVLRLGKRINSWLSVGYDQGISNAPNKLLLELRLTPQVTLESNTEGELGISWRKIY